MKKILSVFLVLLMLSACAQGIPPEALQWNEQSMEMRQLQTRKFDTTDEKKLLTSAAGVLQDLGFGIDESETRLGVIVGSKDRDATEAGQVAAMILVAALGGGAMPIDDKQKIRASVVTHKANSKQTNLRITFQRVVWNTQGQISKTESIEDDEIYQEFFQKLSKSVFLEAQDINI